MRSLAKNLMAHESLGDKTAGAKVSATLHVTEKLRPRLANLMGMGGFRALLSRALLLANAEVPWLSAVRMGL
jgi:hypothetical protein